MIGVGRSGERPGIPPLSNGVTAFLKDPDSQVQWAGGGSEIPVGVGGRQKIDGGNLIRLILGPKTRFRKLESGSETVSRHRISDGLIEIGVAALPGLHKRSSHHRFGLNNARPSIHYRWLEVMGPSNGDGGIEGSLILIGGDDHYFRTLVPSAAPENHDKSRCDPKNSVFHEAENPVLRKGRIISTLVRHAWNSTIEEISGFPPGSRWDVDADQEWSSLKIGRFTRGSVLG